MRLAALILVLMAGGTVLVPAQVPSLPAPGSRLVTSSACAAELGSGVRSRRTFCDVITAATGGPSVTVSVPPREGQAVLFFDLHNRFDLPGDGLAPAAAYVRHQAVVRIVDDAGAVLARAAVVREFRSDTDLFDQLAGGGRTGGVKGVAPGPPEPVRVTIPAGPSTIGIVGESLRVRAAGGRDDLFDAPGRPVAIASNIRLEYRPRSR